MEKFFSNNIQKKPNKRSASRGKLDDSFQINKSRKSGKAKFNEQIIYDVIIIGAGISGLLAAQILLRQEKNVLVLESKEQCGGSIQQKTINQMINPQQQHSWIKQNDLVKNTKVQIGTSQLRSDHAFMIKLCSELDLTMSPMYSDGKMIYAQSQSCIKTVLSMMDVYFCHEHKKSISKLLAKIQNISKNIKQAHTKINNNSGKAHYLNVLKQYIDKFDRMTVRQFLTTQLQDQNLRSMVINQFQIVESIQVDKVSMFLVFLHQYGLQNLKYFTHKKSYLTQHLRIKEGNVQLIDRLKSKVLKQQKKNNFQENVLRFNETVIQIKNQINKEVEVITKNGSYKCFKVFCSATMDSANKVKISKLSDAKRLVLHNQEEGNLKRSFLIFQTAFWRSKFSGNGVFSDKFPLSQMIDFSPSNLSCGILCFVFCGSKVQKWKHLFDTCQNINQKRKEQKQYLLNLVAKMFLNGKRQSQLLQNVELYVADSDNYCYQTFTKVGIAYELQKKNQDYLSNYTRDQHNIIFLGSQLSKKFGSYMQGAVRHTRQQIYNYLQIQDPWGKL